MNWAYIGPQPRGRSNPNSLSSLGVTSISWKSRTNILGCTIIPPDLPQYKSRPEDVRLITGVIVVLWRYDVSCLW